MLGIFGLSMHTTERDLKDLFSKYGKLTQVRLIIDKRVCKIIIIIIKRVLLKLI